MKLLAIDCGASSGRAILGELEGTKLSLKEVHRFKNEMLDRDGRKHWDIHRLHAEVVESLRKAGPEPVSVGIDTWGVDYGLVDKKGQVIGLPFAYRDNRTQPMVDYVHSVLSESKLFSINGLQVMPFNTIYQLADDVKSRPMILSTAARIQFIPDLLGYLLTGEFTAEYSIASTSGLLDAHARQWSDEILMILKIPRHLFPKLTPPGGASFPLKREVAKATGFRGTLTLAASHDTACAVAAAPLEGPDSIYISSGTWSIIGMELDQPVLTPQAKESTFSNEGGVDNTIRFLKNIMGLWLVQELQRVWASRGTDLGFGDICAQAGKAPAFAALVNPNNSRFFAPKDMQHEIQEECRRTGQSAPSGVGPLARCVFESLAMAYRECMEKLQRLTGQKIKVVNVVGGGVQNKLLCQMTADACGVPVHAGPVEATAIGNLIVQAVAHKAVKDFKQAREIVKKTFPLDIYQPSDQDAWHNAWERYKNLPA